MSEVMKVFSEIENLKAIGGCTMEQLNEAQLKLELNFPEEYKEYLINYGAVRFNGVELCGLNIEGYLNVVEATNQEKSVNPNFPKGMFVVEDLGIDTKLVACDENGYIYLFQRDKKRLLCTSFAEYVEKCNYR